jgi:hypothetical protein
VLWLRGDAVLGIAATLMAGCSALLAAPQPATVPTLTSQPARSSNPAASRPGGATLKIVAPTAGVAANAGTVKVSVAYSGPLLVPAAEAKKLDDYHLHYFLDEDAGPYMGTTRPVPSGNPHIVHSAAREVTFDDLPAGGHTLTVLMSGNDHISVNPPVTDSVTFQLK